MNRYNDFEIENGVLKKYRGSGGNVIIPDGVTSIGDDAFWGCSSLTSIIIPDNITSIGGTAFCGCSGLTSITIPDSVKSIGEYAFEYTKIKRFEISSGNRCYKAINGNLYTYDEATLVAYACGKEDDNFVIPDSVTSIYSYAFNGCSGLTSITIPNSVTSIGGSAFVGCKNLKYIICSEETEKLLNRKRRSKSIVHFWKLIKNENASDDVVSNFITMVTENVISSFRALKNDIEFYSFALENYDITAEDAEQIIEFTDSIECRATLLQYINNKTINS